MKLVLLGVIWGLVIPLFGQKANYRQAEKFRKAAWETGSLNVRPHFLENSDKFWYSYKTEDGTRYYFVDPAKKTQDFLFENEYMAQELTKITSKPYSIKSLPLKDLEFNKDGKTLKFKVDEFHYEYNVKTRLLEQKDSVKNKKDENYWAKYSPDSTYIVFARKHNLYLMKANDKDSVEIQLTEDGEPFYSYASNSRDTSSKRTWARAHWLKDSKKLYVVRSDERKVKDLWVIDILSKRPRLEEYRYTMPGDKEVAQHELLIFDVASREKIKVNTEKWPDQSLRILHTGKSTDRLFFQRKKRTCDELEICTADLETGEVTVLIQEKSKPYFNDQLYHFSVLEEGKDLIWWSERTGWGHFYHYDGKGTLKNAITSGEWVAGKMLRVDTAGRSEEHTSELQSQR